MRRVVPMFITFLMGLYMVIGFFVPHKIITDSTQEFQKWDIIILSFAMFLGVGSLLAVHGEKISRRVKGWWYSVVLIICLLGMTLIGIFGGIQEGTIFIWLFNNMMIPMEATMFSLLAFFIASAAYRAFRARNKEATLLLLAAVIVMLGRVPLGTMIWRLFPIFGQRYPDLLINLTEWIMNVPNMVGQRGIMIGAGLGAVSMALRMMLGIERSYLATGSSE